MELTMQTIDLGGEWTLRQSDKKELNKAAVPGNDCVSTA